MSSKKYKWNSLTIHDIDWKLHLTQFNKLPPLRKRSVARFIHHRPPSVNMMFDYKHRCMFCAMSLDESTDHDHYLTCAFTCLSKTKHLNSLTLKLDKLHTPPFLRDTIIHAIDQYYNNGLVDDLPESCPISPTPYRMGSVPQRTDLNLFSSTSQLVFPF